MNSILDEVLEKARLEGDKGILSHRWEKNSGFHFGTYYGCKCGCVMLAYMEKGEAAYKYLISRIGENEMIPMCSLSEEDHLVAEIIE